MDPITIITAASAAATLLQTLLPEIQAMANKGQISPEDQQKLWNSIQGLKSSAAFQGPEWTIDPNPSN